MANTYETIGEQAALDGLVTGTLTDFEDDRVTNLRTYAFYKSPIRNVKFPSVTRIDSYCFGTSKIETVDIGEICNIYQNAFVNCYDLVALFLRSTSEISKLMSGNVFDSSPIKVCKGGIYVPQSLLSDYKSQSTWSNFANVIYPISAYPVTDFSTILLTWAQIKAAIQNETFFSSSYAVGDYKQFTYSYNNTDYTVLAEIRKIDTTNKYVDFVIKFPCQDIKMSLIQGSQRYRYANSQTKVMLDSIYADGLPSDLKTAITPVTKYYYSAEGTDELTVPLWLLNTKDAGFTGSDLKEENGEEYFTDNTSRTKLNSTYGSFIASKWWLGTYLSSSNVAHVNTNGTPTKVSPGTSLKLVFGFRIAKTSS